MLDDFACGYVDLEEKNSAVHNDFRHARLSFCFREMGEGVFFFGVLQSVAWCRGVYDERSVLYCWTGRRR